MSPIDVHVGGILRRRREAIPQSLTEAAADIGLDVADLMRIESGRQRASAQRLRALCRHYAVTPADLYRGMVIEVDGVPPGVVVR